MPSVRDAVDAMAFYQGFVSKADAPLSCGVMPMLCYGTKESDGAALCFCWLDRLTTAQHGPLKAAVRTARLRGRCYIMTNTACLCKCQEFACGTVCRHCGKAQALLGARVTLLSSQSGLGAFFARGIDFMAAMKANGYLLDVDRPVCVAPCASRLVFSKRDGLDAVTGARCVRTGFQGACFTAGCVDANCCSQL